MRAPPIHPQLMSRQSSKLSSGRLFLLLLLLVCGVTLLFLSSSVSRVSAQRRSPVRSTQRKPVAQPKPTPTPTALERLGEPPPVPKLKAQPEQDVAPGEVISVDTTEVMLPVTVRDRSGQLVNNLTRNDFRVFEDSSEQPLSDLALRQVPVDAVLMVDASS